MSAVSSDADGIEPTWSEMKGRVGVWVGQFVGGTAKD